MKSQVLINQIFYFSLAGFFAVATDYTIYRVLSELLGLIFSKILGFYSGVVVSFLINGSYTFRRNGSRFITFKYFFKYFIALSVSMLINVYANYFLLYYLSSVPKINFIAFCFATFLSMMFNFVSQKLIVFK